MGFLSRPHLKKTREPALNHDVVHPAGLAIHALKDAQKLEECLVFADGKLAVMESRIAGIQKCSTAALTATRTGAVPNVWNPRSSC